jgi:hypothetical protein
VWGIILTQICMGGVKDELPTSNKGVNTAVKKIGKSSKPEMNEELKGRSPGL